MIRVFGYLLACTARNRARRMLARLRQPRYLAAMVVGLLYVWSIFLRPGRPSPLAGATVGALGESLYALLIATFVAGWWLFGDDKPALAFSPAEVQLLFTAPVTRRQLIRYKLLQAQLAIFVSVVIWVAILRRSGSTSLAMRGIALFVLFSTMYLHRVGASLVRHSALQHGLSGVRRHLVPIIIAGVAIGAMAGTLLAAIPDIQRALLGPSLDTMLDQVVARPGIAIPLLPFRAAVAPVFAKTPAEWLRAILPAMLLMALHYPWVLRSDTAFEEAAAEAAERRAQSRAAARSRLVRGGPLTGPVRPTRWPLAATGEPWMAIVWKNLVGASRLARPRLFLVFVVAGAVIFTVALYTSRSLPDSALLLAMLSAFFLALTALLGPGMMRNDLRRDLLKLELVRAYPLSGRTLVAAEIASSALVLTAVEYLLAVVGGAFVLLSGIEPGRAFAYAPLVVSGLIALPAVNALRTAISNATALLFPAWVPLGDLRTSGIETMGQGLLTTAGSLLVMLALLAVPGVFAIAASVWLDDAMGDWAVVAGTLIGVAAVGAELWLMVRWLGGVFARTEPLATDSGA